MHEIRGAVSGAADAATALAEHSARIGEVLHVIEEIAGETNLLALNASIIAAQAGESGKTFSVLADDIRDLSDRTAVSTDEVRGLVSSVRSGVEDVRRLLAEARRRTEEGVDLAQTSDATLDEIETLALDSRRASEGIASAADDAEPRGGPRLGGDLPRLVGGRRGSRRRPAASSRRPGPSTRGPTASAS